MEEQQRKLGLPFGATMILIAVVQIANSSYVIFMRTGFTFSKHWEGVDAKERYAITLIADGIQGFVDLICLWIGTIILGNSYALMVWIFMSSVRVVYLWHTIFVLLQYYANDISGLVISKWPWLLANVYLIGIYTCWYIYVIVNAIDIVDFLRKKLFEEIHPIGTGVNFIWKYFTHNVAIAVRFLLTAEVILNLYVFLCWKSLDVAFDNLLVKFEEESTTFYCTEEYIIRWFRLAMASVGLYSIQVKKEGWKKIWCALSGVTWLASLGIFLYLTVGWSATNPWYTYGYLAFFAISLGFRFILIFAGSNLNQNDLMNT